MEDSILRILVILAGIALVAVILIQQPKEGGLGAFTGGGGGGGASNTIFGAKGSGNFLFKLTVGIVLAFVFFIVMLVKVSNTSTAKIVSSPEALEQKEKINSNSLDATNNGTIPSEDKSGSLASPNNDEDKQKLNSEAPIPVSE